MIRKISIGSDYKEGMHYTVGQPFNKITIDSIQKVNPDHYEIWIKTDKNEIILWKEVVNMPVVIEKDIKAFG